MLRERALRLHWVLAYFFMLNGALYLLGLIAGGGWRALLPPARMSATGSDDPLLSRSDPDGGAEEALATIYRCTPSTTPCSAPPYFSMPLFGTLVVLSGWAMQQTGAARLARSACS